MRDYIFTERPELENKIHIAYCPERVLPGNVMYELVHNDRVIGGVDEASTQKAIAFYKDFVKGELHATNARTAEMCKLTENASRNVQIAFANELSLICDKADINVWELIQLANKHPRVNILQPGCGVGGHCITVDPYFITSEFPMESQIIGKAREINNYKSFWCAQQIKQAKHDFQLKHGRQPAIALMGLAFKPNIDDLRESPAKYIVQKVLQEAQDETYFIVEPNIKDHQVFKITDYQTAAQQADIVALLVAHDEFKNLNLNPQQVVLDFCGVRE
jgi:UDP-N-acetyl-D-mannosaminuronic acid dehydrogenase